jgi:F-type H+-transporting ATPase subunit b
MKRWLLITLFAIGTVFAQERAENKDSAEHKTSEPAEGPAEIWKWANFAILAVGIGYFMAKILPPLFTARTTEIQKGISEAQQMKQDAERRSAEMDARLAALGADIEKFRVQSGAEMRQEGERIARDTAAQIKKIESQAAVEIESAGKTARRQLKEYAAELALGLAEERLRSRMDSAIESALVDNFVRDLERQNAPKAGSKN